jgi:hypothetical protein
VPACFAVDRKTAANVDRLSRNEASRAVEEERHGIGGVCRLTEPADRFPS